ncbi:MAG: hydrolase 2, exosortase A system-associated [Burkholderiales bacterium]|nr:hydrolase 2, exosortase A system-associated [Burkholderiales bacterium]
MTTASSPDVFFLPRGDGQRLCLFHPAAGGVAKAALVYVHPFAEEMNKSRRMAALQARALAEAGCAVLQIDLAGCGDSSGDFGDASWQGWVDDVLAACRWLRERESAPLWLWGLRAGALLCTAAAAQLEDPPHLLLWQPAGQGKATLQQFVRLKAAGSLADGNAKAVLAAVRQDLDRGLDVEIAGYRVAASLARGLEGATLAPPARAGRLEWIELSTLADASLSPAASTALARWQQAGWQVRSHLVNGPAFWQTTEIEDAPALLPASVAALALPS